MDLLQAYNQLAGKYGLHSMQAGGLTIATQAFDDPDALWQALQQHSPAQGWLQFQSWQGLFLDGLPEVAADRGLLLQAEAVCADGSSLAIGPDGQGGWRLSHYRPADDGDLLWDEVAHIAHDGAACLNYRRYWVEDAEQGLLQRLAILIGIEQNGGK